MSSNPNFINIIKNCTLYTGSGSFIDYLLLLTSSPEEKKIYELFFDGNKEKIKCYYSERNLSLLKRGWKSIVSGWKSIMSGDKSSSMIKDIDPYCCIVFGYMSGDPEVIDLIIQQECKDEVEMEGKMWMLRDAFHLTCQCGTGDVVKKLKVQMQFIKKSPHTSRMPNGSHTEQELCFIQKAISCALRRRPFDNNVIQILDYLLSLVVVEFCQVHIVFSHINLSPLFSCLNQGLFDASLCVNNVRLLNYFIQKLEKIIKEDQNLLTNQSNSVVIEKRQQYQNTLNNCVGTALFKKFKNNVLYLIDRGALCDYAMYEFKQIRALNYGVKSHWLGLVNTQSKFFIERHTRQTILNQLLRQFIPKNVIKIVIIPFVPFEE